MCTALYMMVLYDRARVGPTTKTLDEISIICLFRLILQANPCFFSVVVFELLRSQMLIPYLFLSGVLILLCEYQSFLDNRDCHVNPFSTGVFLFKWIRSFQHPQDHLSFFSNVVCFICPQVAFVFPPSHPFYFKESDV